MTRHHTDVDVDTTTPDTDSPDTDAPTARHHNPLPDTDFGSARTEVENRIQASRVSQASAAPRPQKRGERGRFVFDPDKPERTKPSVEEDPHQRPGLRETTRDEIWDYAVANSHDGKVRDPETGEIIDRDSNWHAGHLPGWEFRKHRAAAQEADTPRDEFIEEYNSYDLFRPETKKTSESHKHEAPDHIDFWKDFYDSK